MKKILWSALGEFAGTLACIGLLVLATPAHASGDMSERLTREAPSLDKSVARRAVQALGCAVGHGKRPDMLIVVDMAKPATRERLYAFDLKSDRLVTKALVAHGKGSDPKFTGIPKVFGNKRDSGMTSLGLYRVAEAYHGKHGLARRLDGLTRGWNDQARARAVVIHSSKYVKKGAVGRSLGCPAVDPETLALLEREGLDNAVLWIDGADPNLGKAVADCKHAYKYAPAVAKNSKPKTRKDDEPRALWNTLALCTPPNPYGVS